MVEGRCKGCGLVRKYSTNYYRNRNKFTRAKVALASTPTRDLSSIAPVRPSTAHNWELLLDSLFHVGGGGWSSFERIAMQVEPTGIFVDHAARLLEAMGHINIARNPDTLRPERWEVAETTLNSSIQPGRLQFVGYWPDSLSNQVFEGVEALGGIVDSVENPHGPVSWLATLSNDENPFPAPVRDVAEEILTAMPALSVATEALPRRNADLTGMMSKFDPLSASWVDTDGMEGIGGIASGSSARWTVCEHSQTSRRMLSRSAPYNSASTSLPSSPEPHLCWLTTRHGRNFVYPRVLTFQAY